MRYLDYLKTYTNFDPIVALFDELGFTDEEIIAKLEISKQTIYNAQTRLQPLMDVLQAVPDPKAITYGNPTINSVIDTFKSSFGTTSASKYDRYAAKRLIDKHTAEFLIKIIKLLASKAGTPYYPTVNSISELEKKWVTVATFLNSEKNSGRIIS